MGMSSRRRGVCAAYPAPRPSHDRAPVELVVVHPGGLSSRCWSRLAAQLPARTPITVLELEGLNSYWAAGLPGGGDVTVNELAGRLCAEIERSPRAGRERVLLGWGAGGVVAHAVAARLAELPRRVVVLDAAAPGAGAEPTEAEILRRFAMFLGARRGSSLAVDPELLDVPVERALAHVLAAARSAGVVRDDTSAATLRRLYDAHARAARRDHRLTQTYIPIDLPLTVVRAAQGGGQDLGWDAETLVSSGDHYSMLTDPAAVSHLAMLLRRWFAPVPVAA